jgi:hypothetical protein
MTPKKRNIVAACVLLTLLSGGINGYISQRWGYGEEMDSAAHRVNAMPLQFGPWKAEKLTKLGDGAEKMLRCAGNVVGAYRHEATGEQVSVVMMVGPAGPLSVHTPEVCYRASNYSVHGNKQQLQIVDDEGEAHNFLSITLRENSAANRLLRVYYSWNRDQQWTSPESPRTTFAGAPMLYKIQVATHVDEGGPPSDAGERFLKVALPLIKYTYTNVNNPENG